MHAPALSSLSPSCGRASAGIGPVATRPRRRFHGHAFSCRLAVLPARGRSVPAARVRVALGAGNPPAPAGAAPARTWIEQPYGEEEISLLEEEVIPAIQQCLARIDELDGRLLAQQELLQRCHMEAERDALAELRLQMA